MFQMYINLFVVFVSMYVLYMCVCMYKYMYVQPFPQDIYYLINKHVESEYAIGIIISSSSSSSSGSVGIKSTSQ